MSIALRLHRFLKFFGRDTTGENAILDVPLSALSDHPLFADIEWTVGVEVLCVDQLNGLEELGLVVIGTDRRLVAEAE